MEANLRNLKRAFTLVELLVAVAVFLAFIGGVFLIYTSGNRVFHGGSWRLQKQKDAESFFNVLRERLEATSYPVVISEGAATAQEYPANVRLASNTFQVGDLGGAPRLLMSFPVCKPFIAGTNSNGLALCHVLFLEPSSEDPSLMTLSLRASTQVADLGGIQGNDPFFPDMGFASSFAGDPRNFGYGSDNKLFTIDEVSSIRVSPSAVIANSSQNTPDSTETPMVDMEIVFRQPKHPRTSVRIELGVRMEIHANLNVGVIQ